MSSPQLSAQLLLQTIDNHAIQPDGGEQDDLLPMPKMTLELLAEHFAVPRHKVVKAAQVLRRRSLVEIPRPGLYRMTQAGKDWLASGKQIKAGGHPKVKKTEAPLYVRAWWHLRAHKRATLRELMCTHADEETPTTNLSLYLKALCRAGILKQVQILPHGEVVWGIEKDVGPRAPVWRQKSGEVYNPNSGETQFAGKSDRHFRQSQLSTGAASHA
jgi:hypothetical protein